MWSVMVQLAAFAVLGSEAELLSDWQHYFMIEKASLSFKVLSLFIYLFIFVGKFWASEKKVYENTGVRMFLVTWVLTLWWD